MTREDIKAQFKAGEITKDQAMTALAGMRGQTPPASRDVIKAQFKAGEITKDQAMAALAGLRGQQQPAAPAPVVDDSLALPQQPAMPAPAPVMRSGVSMPAPTGGGEQGPAPDYSFSGRFKSFVDKISGADRSTPEIEGMDDWTNMPELGGYDLPSLKVKLSRLLSSDQGNIKSTILNNFPELEKNLRTDDKGNPYFVSDVDFKRYAIKPGIRMTDAPGIVGETLMSAVGPGLVAKGARAVGLGGRAAGLGGRVVGEGLTQGAIEGARAATGGDASLTNVGVAALTPAALDVVPRVVQGARGLKEADKVFDDVLGEAPSAERVQEQVMSAAEVGEAAKKAGKSRKARRKVTSAFEPKVERATFADKELGLAETPADILAVDDVASMTAGVPRKVQDSPAFREWVAFKQDFSDKADSLIESAGAVYTQEGKASVSDAANIVKARFESSLAKLRKDASKTYDDVAEKMPRGTQMDMANTREYLEAEIADAGADASPMFKKLLDQLDDEGVTALGLKHKKAKIREALGHKDNAYSKDLSQRQLEGLNKVLSADELATYSRIAGEDAADELRLANQKWAESKELENKVYSNLAFGATGQGDFGGRLLSEFKKINTSQRVEDMLDIVPDDMKGDLVMSAIAQTATSKRGAVKGAFGSAEFNDFMSKLKLNSKRYGQIKGHIGAKRMEMLEGLHDFSKAVQRGTEFGPKGTGADLQPIVQALEAENFVSALLNHPIVSGLVSRVPVVGKASDMVIGGLANLTSTGGQKGVEAVHKFLTSSAFKKDMADAVAKGITQERAARRLAFSRPFREFAKAAKLPREPKALENWILRSFRAGETLALNKDSDEQ